MMEANMSKMVCLNGSNYHIWKGKMKDLLFVKKMHLPVFASNKPETMSDEDWEFEHLQANPSHDKFLNPTRKTFFEFLNRFGLLAPEVLEGQVDEKVACKKILEKMGLAGSQAHPFHEKFINKKIELFEDVSLVCGNDRVRISASCGWINQARTL